jgi:hypothetical protein
MSTHERSRALHVRAGFMIASQTRDADAMAAARTPPWKKPKPAGAKSTPLTARQKTAARQRADAAGRRYPNLIDNMWAATQPR